MKQLADLSPREREVLTLYAQGLLGKQIADRLGVAERTVDTHRQGIHRKLRMNLWAACAQAGKAGWV